MEAAAKTGTFFPARVTGNAFSTLGTQRETFTSLLRRALHEADCTVSEAAERIGISRTQLNRALNRGRHFPAAWVPALPRKAVLVILDEWAGNIGHEVSAVEPMLKALCDLEFARLLHCCVNAVIRNISDADRSSLSEELVLLNRLSAFLIIRRREVVEKMGAL